MHLIKAGNLEIIHNYYYRLVRFGRFEQFHSVRDLTDNI